MEKQSDVSNRKKARPTFLYLCGCLAAAVGIFVLVFGLLVAMPSISESGGENTGYADPRNAKPKSTIVIQREKVMESYVGDDAGWIALSEAGTSNVVYAYDICSDWPKSGSIYELQGEAGPGLTYLLNHSYPLSPITNRDEIDQYITQTAIWRYLSLSGKTTRVSPKYLGSREAYEGLLEKEEALAKKAVEAEEWGYASAGYGYKRAYVYVNQDDPLDRLLFVPGLESENKPK